MSFFGHIPIVIKIKTVTEKAELYKKVKET